MRGRERERVRIKLAAEEQGDMELVINEVAIQIGPGEQLFKKAQAHNQESKENL